MSTFDKQCLLSTTNHIVAASNALNFEELAVGLIMSHAFKDENAILVARTCPANRLITAAHEAQQEGFCLEIVAASQLVEWESEPRHSIMSGDSGRLQRRDSHGSLIGEVSVDTIAAEIDVGCQSLGVGLTHDLTISNINAGPLLGYNETHADRPICVGDRFVEVNGDKPSTVCEFVTSLKKEPVLNARLERSLKSHKVSFRDEVCRGESVEDVVTFIVSHKQGPTCGCVMM